MKVIEQAMVACVVGIVVLGTLAAVLPIITPYIVALGLLAIAWRVAMFFTRP